MDARRGPTAATLLSVLHTMDTCYLHMHSDQICRTCTKLGTCPSPNFEEKTSSGRRADLLPPCYVAVFRRVRKRKYSFSTYCTKYLVSQRCTEDSRLRTVHSKI
jgi:hypothetical protein